jgi:phosphatidate cytidylyltransferase
MNHELIKRLLTSIIVAFLTFFFIFQGGFIFDIFLLCLLFISFYEWFNLQPKKLTLFLGYTFLIVCFLSAYILRNESFNYFLLIIIISISSDIGGFIFGKIIKGPKLTKISPNKTYAGAFGSFLLSIICCFIYSHYFDSSIKNFFNVFSINFFVFIFIISTINQIGDLIISYFKRLKNIDDTGTLLPGHGGLLDRIDGMIFAIFFSYIFYLFL